MRVFIICRDRLSGIEKLLPWVDHMDVTFVDNASTYPPLLEFYAHTHHKVYRSDSNRGHRAPWIYGLTPAWERYIVTDPDVIPDDDCPADWCTVMQTVLKESGAKKVGFGLRIDDIPDHYAAKEQVLKWEGPLWGCREDVAGYKAHAVPIDTTFAMYAEGTRCGEFESPSDIWPAYRLGEPYVARHLPWYSDSANPTEEDVYYREHAEPSIVNWTFDRASSSHGG